VSNESDARCILVTGGTGQVGHELVRELALLGRVVAPTSAELDLASADSIRTAVRRLHPAAIVNAGAYTAVDRAESDRERCMAINAVAPGILAQEATALGAPLVHFSTDYVFGGDFDRPIREDDPTGPLGVYGSTKLAGEHAVLAEGAAHAILRTSWVYGTRGTNFLRTMLRLARERDELRVVDDQVGAPTWSRSIAAGTAVVLREMLSGAAGAGGVYHLAAAGRTSWHEFAEAIVAGDPRREEQRCRRVTPIRTAEYLTPARRPAWSVLDSGRVRERFGIAIPDWREQLALVLADLTA
jgi:dTDP-4-dehydrorhamnose reductase